jgi:hypothetical protein
MANQIMTVVETQLPAEPDLAALSQMQAPIVMVHKITRGEKNRENTQLVINGLTGLSMSDILKLQDQLPTGQVPNSGPGVYRFSVTDGDSAAKASWQTRLGGAVENNAVAATPGLPSLQTMAHGTALPFGAVPTAAAVQAVQVPLSATARPIGNGFYYDEALGLLTAPDGSIHAWRKGQPLPGLMTTSAVGSTPVSALPGPGVPFFAPSPELEMTKQALAVTQRALEEAQRQREQERAETARQKEITELRDSIKAIGLQLSARPAENSEVADLKRQLESQNMLAALQASTKAQIDAIMAIVREQGSNRGVDPVISVITSMMQQGQQAAQESLRMVRETAGAERQTLMTVLDRQAAMAEKAAANNPLEKVGSILDVLVERFGRVMQIEREFSGGGGGTDWVGIIKEAVGKAGSAVEMYQQAKAQEARATEATARAQIATAQASVSRDRTLVAIKGGKPAAPATPAGAPAAPVSVPQTPAAPSTKVRVALPDLEKATVGELREIFGPERDESFFGSFYDHVKQLRMALLTSPAQFGAKKIAELLMQAREHLAAEAQAGRGVPHAAEIWAHGQIAYLLERLLPEAAEGLRSEVVKALTMLEAEAEDAERIAANTSDDGDGEGDAS